MSIFTKLIAAIPESLQSQLKRERYRRQIKKGVFHTEEPEYEVLEQYVSPGDWVIDIGANIGHYTNKLSELVGPKGRVIAFEPIPITFALLSQNTSFNRYKNTTLVNSAVSDSCCTASMSVPNYDSGIKNYYQAAIVTNETADAIQVLTLSIDSLNIKNRISLIKIDAEGHEPSVLAGMIGLITRDFPTLIIETVTAEMADLFIRLGYSEVKLLSSPNVIYVNDK